MATPKRRKVRRRPRQAEELYRCAAALPLGRLHPLCDALGDAAVRLRLSVCHLGAGQELTVPSKGLETALLAVEGKGVLCAGALRQPFDRKSWVAQSPAAIHAPAGTGLSIEARERCEVVVVQTPNAGRFAARALKPESIATEDRGKGKASDTARRTVRTVFDGGNSPQEARLVLGEVVSSGGRWSSYPPHHHAQPELYYYRFDKPQGYGHAECGENVYKVRDHDVLSIPGGKDHPQCAAPGYTMYYLWAVRHLEEARYQGFEYAAEHRWVFEE